MDALNDVLILVAVFGYLLLLLYRTCRIPYLFLAERLVPKGPVALIAGLVAYAGILLAAAAVAFGATVLAWWGSAGAGGVPMVLALIYGAPVYFLGELILTATFRRIERMSSLTGSF